MPQSFKIFLSLKKTFITPPFEKLIIIKQEKNLKTSCETSKDFMDYKAKIDINKIQHLKMFFNKKTIDWYSKRADTISYQAERIGQNKK